VQRGARMVGGDGSSDGVQIAISTHRWTVRWVAAFLSRRRIASNRPPLRHRIYSFVVFLQFGWCRVLFKSQHRLVPVTFRFAVQLCFCFVHSCEFVPICCPSPSPFPVWYQFCSFGSCPERSNQSVIYLILLCFAFSAQVWNDTSVPHFWIEFVFFSLFLSRVASRSV